MNLDTGYNYTTVRQKTNLRDGGDGERTEQERGGEQRSTKPVPLGKNTIQSKPISQFVILKMVSMQVALEAVR